LEAPLGTLTIARGWKGGDAANPGIEFLGDAVDDAMFIIILRSDDSSLKIAILRRKGAVTGHADTGHLVSPTSTSPGAWMPLNSRYDALSEIEQYREATLRRSKVAGVMCPSFRCRKCGCFRQASGRRQVVRGTSRYGYHCGRCVGEAQRS